jgi:uncharacterized protein YcaQ
MPQLSAAEARRVALAAQGFAVRRSSVLPGRRALGRLVGRLGLFQMDSVNVLVRAHYLPAFSRLGPYPTQTLDGMAYRPPRELFEYWGHEASLLPVETQPLLRWRMQEAHKAAWGSVRRIARDKPGFVERTLEEIRACGPLAASELEGERPRRGGPWWDRHDSKVALEWLFWSGQVTTAGRRGFERLYDMPERVLPPSVLASPTPAREDAQRELLRIASRAMGVATEADLRDYFRLDVDDARGQLAELVQLGELLPVTVAGWRQPAYLHREARIPRAVDTRSLVAPFDPLVWSRPRTERLFGMRYRVEIYVPAPRRVHGYYVLPFLLGDRLVARVDLKADRQAGLLRVQGAHLELEHDPARVALALAAELRSMADWLGLPGIAVSPFGDLASPLVRAVAG